MSDCLHRFGILLPYLFISAYSVGLIASIMFEKESFAINGTILALPAIVASVILLSLRKGNFHPDHHIVLFQGTNTLYYKLFFVVYLFFISAAITMQQQLFPKIIVLALYIIISVQILSKNCSPSVIVLEIILTMMATIYNTTFQYPLYIGYSDITAHIFLSHVTLLQGHTIPYELSNYAYFPLYHILISQSSALSNLDIQTTLFLITCPIYCTLILFMYLISLRIFQNNQISLVVILTLSMQKEIVFNGTYMVTKAMAFIGFYFLLYILYYVRGLSGSSENNQRGIFRALAVVTVIFLTLVHHTSSLQFIMILLLIVICELIAYSGFYLQRTILPLFFALSMTYWIFLASPFVQDYLMDRLNPELVGNLAIMQNPHPLLGWSFVLDQLDILVMMFLAVIGIGYTLAERHPAYSKGIFLLSLIGLVLLAPTPLQTVWQIIGLFGFDRIIFFLIPFVVMSVGFGLIILSAYLMKWRWGLRAAQVTVVVLISLYGIGSLGYFDEDEKYFPRKFFDQQELEGFQHVLEKIPHGTDLYSDYPTVNYFNFKRISCSDQLGLPYYNSYMIQNASDLGSRRGYILYAQGCFLNKGLYLGKGNELDPSNLQYYPPSAENRDLLQHSMDANNKIYSNSGLEIFTV